MASAFQFPSANKLLGSGAYMAAYASPESVLLNNNRVFPIQPVYVGPTARTIRYQGVKTDAQVYLGTTKLFDR